MEFIQLVLLEAVLLLCAGIIFFGGIWGTVVATVALSVINYLAHDSAKFWYWEITVLISGVVGIILLFIIGRLANKTEIVGGLIGGLATLVLFGAFTTPIVAILLWALVIGTGVIPKSKKSKLLWSLTPTFLRIILGLGWIIFGNFLTI